jgi:lysozyme
MNRQKIMDQLAIDEGKRLDVYKDSLGFLTVGIGHLVLSGDGLHERDVITEEKCKELFEHDFERAIREVNMLFNDIETYPEQIQDVLVNLMFNMGPLRLLGFHYFIAAIKARDFNEAANQLRGSLWYTQVGERAVRIVATVRGCKDNAVV